MSRHFVEKAQWNDPWLQSLSFETKLLWFYIRDHVDPAGVWDANYEDAENKCGFTKRHVEIDWDKVLTELNTPYVSRLKQKVNPKAVSIPQVLILESDKWWLTKYVVFHNGSKLYDFPEGEHRKGNFHRPVFRSLRKHGLLEQFRQFFPGVEIITSATEEPARVRKQFVRPTMEQVIEHSGKTFPEMPSNNAELFWHHYNTLGWKINGEIPEVTWMELFEKWHKTWQAKQNSRKILTESVAEKQKRIALLEVEIAEHKKSTYRPEGALIDYLKPEAKQAIAQCKELIKKLEDEIKNKTEGTK